MRWAGRLVALCLLLQCQVALALGLGQVEVRSRAGEPLLAEIPIISTDPAELENLQARLASPETFRRIGLDPPAGLVSDLRFTVALDAQGRPVIRITTDVPVQQPVLNFLVEVEWAQGRLVREYSALVDTPQTVAAPAQPPIQAPQAAPSNLIERPAIAAPAEPAPADGADAATADESSSVDADADAEAVASETPAGEPVPEPAPAPAPPPASPAVTPVATSVPGEIGPVQAGQTLGQIASSLSAGSGHSLNQVMLALLRANPEAFIGGNLNLIRQGAVLRVPAADTWSQASVAEANALVRDHVSRWRELRRPVAQPDAVAGDRTPDAEAGDRPADASPAAASRMAEARLEIVPAAAGAGASAGTRTGTAAGGEGDMLQQQELVQTRETLAARDAEVEELRTRLAELEQLQQQQSQLIAMKDSELAAAQQRLAESNARPAASVAESGAAAPVTEAGGAVPWLWIGLGLVAAALLVAWLVSRRRATSERKSGPSFATASNRSTPRRAVVVPTAPEAPAPASSTAEPPVVPVERASSWQAPPPAASGASPTWHAAGEARTPDPDDAPTTGAPPQSQSQSQTQVQPESTSQAAAGHDRIELARAYLDLGDTDTARSLLQEVADAGDPDARDEARRLLRDMA
ncbi:type IV pilus assembly protein FimV [Luteimonas kalidii]|uniref:FimV/HubP family polar landmark protein n=1 Tax=Luteimonas kalidii TaxID=3042025 RepID=A0ABT6JTQ9_9GAMM|nr:FimV/HubP family polar landmark protein [Luteimonas kalidii]MDH5834063.1 FimV/HubP family polar landmark protein [Luteimonas kalidii]